MSPNWDFWNWVTLSAIFRMTGCRIHSHGYNSNDFLQQIEFHVWESSWMRDSDYFASIFPRFWDNIDLLSKEKLPTPLTLVVYCVRSWVDRLTQGSAPTLSKLLLKLKHLCTPLRILLICKFRFGRSRVGWQVCISNRCCCSTNYTSNSTRFPNHSWAHHCVTARNRTELLVPLDFFRLITSRRGI